MTYLSSAIQDIYSPSTCVCWPKLYQSQFDVFLRFETLIHKIQWL